MIVNDDDPDKPYQKKKNLGVPGGLPPYLSFYRPFFMALKKSSGPAEGIKTRHFHCIELLKIVHQFSCICTGLNVYLGKQPDNRIGNPHSAMTTQAIEDYLKVIFKLSASGKKVSTSAIAKKLSVAQASVTGMLKKLAEMHLIEYLPYKEIRLTEAGRKIALETIRHHRLLELYLKEAMGYSWDKVHEEAEHLEHHISEEFEEKIDEFLGRPTVDPHGAPIPTKDGHLPEETYKPLTQVEPGTRAIIRRVSDDDPEKLRYLGKLNLYPNTEIDVLHREPFNGPTKIKAGDQMHYLSKELCDNIYVDELP